MATCKICGSSGLFLRVNKYGLCSSCYQAAILEAQSNLRVINESSQIISRSKNTSTRLSRCNIVEECANRLLKYENVGVPITDPLPSEILKKVSQWRRQIIVEAAKSAADEAEAKASVSDSYKAAAKHYNSALLKVTGYLHNVTEPPAEVLEIQSNLRAKMRKASFDALVDEARKAEFKGHVAKALDKYKEALYVLRTDSVDDTLQSEEINEIEAKINELEALKGKT